MDVERTSAFEPISVAQEQVGEIIEAYKSQGSDILVMPDLDAEVPPWMVNTNFRLPTLVIRPVEIDGALSIGIYQRHVPIETLRDSDKSMEWASKVGTDQEYLPINELLNDELEYVQTGSCVDLILTFDEATESWTAQGRTLYPNYKGEDPAGLLSTATTRISINRQPNVNDLPIAA